MIMNFVAAALSCLFAWLALSSVRRIKESLTATTSELVDLRERIENAAQAASETHSSWEHRCYAILAGLGLDFGEPRISADAAADLERLVGLADNIRAAQKAYMADRGNEEKGRAVAAAAEAYDAARNDYAN